MSIVAGLCLKLSGVYQYLIVYLLCEPRVLEEKPRETYPTKNNQYDASKIDITQAT
jgi:hypothetical protein